MSKIIFHNILRFTLLIFFQVLILERVYLGNYVTPFFYILFIVMLPVNTPKWLLLISSFLLGFSIDMFAGIAGFHAFSATLTGFLRIFIIRLAFSQAELEELLTPSLQTLRLKTFIGYAATIVFIHHFFYFLVEAFSFSEILQILLRTILSSIVTLILIIIYQFLFVRGKRIG